MRVRWLASGLVTLQSSLRRIHEENPPLAADVANRIDRSIQRLEGFPLSGRPGTVAETRELVIPRLPYVVVYRVTKTEVQVLRVFHHRQEQR